LAVGGQAMPTSLRAVFFVATALGLAAAVLAAETITYSYDARGRLVRVVHNGSVNNNVSANYVYDKADNRTNVNVISPNVPQ
jgi:YD repeat-containing protein